MRFWGWQEMVLSLFALLLLGLTQGATASATSSGVQAWGSNSLGTLGRGGTCGELAPKPPESYVPLAVPGMPEVKAIAVGTNDFDHELALLANGEVEAWGSNGRGQLGDGLPGTGPVVCNGLQNYSFSSTPEPVVGLTKVKAIAAGGNHNLALLTNGTVMAWGLNNAGQLGDGALGPEQCAPNEEALLCSSKPVAVSGLKKVKAIAAGGDFSLALLKNGTVMAWGANEYWQLGQGSPSFSDMPIEIPGLTKVKAIAAGWNHALALLKNGTAMAWGGNSSGDLGIGTFAEGSYLPTAVKKFGRKELKAKAISASRHTSIAVLTNGHVVDWGAGGDGALGDGCETEPCSRDEPVEASGLSEVTTVAAGPGAALALLTSGTVMSWGHNSGGDLGNGKPSIENAYTPESVFGLTGALGIGIGSYSALALG